MLELTRLTADLASGDDLRAERACAALARHGPAALPALLRLARAPATDHRWWAMHGLAGVFDGLADQALIDGLSDPEVSVRQAACLALRDRPMAPAVSRLVHLLHAEDALASRLAGDALTALGSVATPALAEVLHDPSGAARIAAARALALNQDPGAVPALYAALQDPSGLVEYWAIEGLERRGLGMVYFHPR